MTQKFQCFVIRKKKFHQLLVELIVPWALITGDEWIPSTHHCVYEHQYDPSVCFCALILPHNSTKYKYDKVSFPLESSLWCGRLYGHQISWERILWLEKVSRFYSRSFFWWAHNNKWVMACREWIENCRSEGRWKNVEYYRVNIVTVTVCVTLLNTALRPLVSVNE